MSFYEKKPNKTQQKKLIHTYSTYYIIILYLQYLPIIIYIVFSKKNWFFSFYINTKKN